jgi:multiple sugar transport system permease protein
MATVTAPSPGTGRRRRRRSTPRSRREALAGYLFISPWIVGFLVFTAGSMLYSLYVSTTDYDIATGSGHPVGLQNYRRLLEDPKVAASLGNTLYYAIMAVPLEICLALVLAFLLNRVRRGSGVFRTLYYLPKMTPSVATASMFLILLNGDSGAINKGLSLFGVHGPQWLVDPSWIKPSIVLLTLWGVSGTVVILLAALKQVPNDLYEAAAIDGAGPVRRFVQVTLPMISGPLFFCVVVLTIAALQVFDQVYLLFFRDATNVAPQSALFYSVYLFEQAFRDFSMGFAAAMAWLLFVIILIITSIQFKFGNKFVYYEGEER